jgi:hypothetical protein
MAFPLPFTPPITTGGPHLPTVDDKLVKDKKVRASVLIRSAGWRGRDAVVARGVMGAESGYNPDAENGDYIGLMQMGLVHAGNFGIPETREAARVWLKNPENNVKAAHGLWKVKGWGPWEAFTNKKYQKHHEDPLITLKTTLSGDVVDTVSDVADAALGPLDELASTLLSKDTWFRAGKGILGFNIAMIGVAGLGLIVALRVSKSAPVKGAVKVAKKIPKVPI